MGLTMLVHRFSSARRGIVCLILLSIVSFFDAHAKMCSAWSDQFSLLFKIIPMFGYLSTSVIWQPFNRMLPIIVFLHLFEIHMKCVLVALKVTLHWSAHQDRESKSWFMLLIVMTGSSTTVNRLVSSAYRRPMCRHSQRLEICPNRLAELL